MRHPTTDAAPVRVLKIVELLFQRVLDGPSTICRDLAVLESTGWVRRLETNRWAITEKPAALMQVYTLYMDDLSRQRDQFAARVQAKARQYLCFNPQSPHPPTDSATDG